jgi:hypothetical protein
LRVFARIVWQLLEKLQSVFLSLGAVHLSATAILVPKLLVWRLERSRRTNPRKTSVAAKIAAALRSRLDAYYGTKVHWYAMDKDLRMIERVQTGVRMEKRLLKVLKALAEFHDLTLGDLLEGIVLHAFDGKCAFRPESLARIRELKKFYGLDLDSSASHRLTEADKIQRLREGKRR